jgi:hypothetical protein
MAMSLIWAPENDMQCVFVISLHPIEFEMSVKSLVGLFLALQISIAIATGFAITSAVLHLMGAGIGFAVAIWMLKTGRVDCENWDAFSVWAGRHNLTRDEREAEKRAADPDLAWKEEAARRRQESAGLEEIRRAIAEGQPVAALKLRERMARELPDWRLPQPDLLALIQAFHAKKQWAGSVPAMVEYLTDYPEKSNLVRLKLGQILVTEDVRPAQAVRVLAKVREECLDERQRTLLAKLRARAGQLHEADPYEVVEGDW